MKRIVMHWTAGGHNVSSLDKRHYHFIIDGDGDVHPGDLPPEANESTKTAYAAHTRRLNTGSIGVSVAAMANAKESPFDAGKYPITPKQVDALAELCADLCETYDIEVTPETVLTHAEVQPTLGVAQRGKWDITWLPGMEKPGRPRVVGDALREMIMEKGVVPMEAPAPIPEIAEAPVQDVPKEVMDLIEDADGRGSKTDLANQIIQWVSGGGAIAVLPYIEALDYRIVLGLIGAAVVVFGVSTYTRSSRKRKSDLAVRAKYALGK